MSVDFRLVFENHIPHLFNLICFGFVSNGLQVENLLHARFVEDDVTATALPAGESGAFEEVAEVCEWDVGIGSPREDVGERFAGFAHGVIGCGFWSVGKSVG
jgi:hypothetical protein